MDFIVGGKMTFEERAQVRVKGQSRKRIRRLKEGRKIFFGGV